MIIDSQNLINQQNNKFWEAIAKRVLIFLSNHKLNQMRNRASYHPFKIQLEYYSNKKEIAIRVNLGC
jgi:hypothetical protein